MKLFSFLSGTPEKSVASAMVDLLFKELPPDMVSREKGVISVNKITRALERAIELAKKHQQDRRLGTFGRARFANYLKWELVGRGYPPDFVELATESLVMELAKLVHSQDR